MLTGTIVWGRNERMIAGLRGGNVPISIHYYHYYYYTVRTFPNPPMNTFRLPAPATLTVVNTSGHWTN